MYSTVICKPIPPFVGPDYRLSPPIIRCYLRKDIRAPNGSAHFHVLRLMAVVTFNDRERRVLKMKKFKVCLVMSLAVGLTLSLWLPAFAARYEIDGHPVSMDGFFRQEIAYNPNDDSPNNFNGIQSAYSMLYMDVSSEFGRSWEVRGIFRLWGDWAYEINKGDDHWDKFFGPARHKQSIYNDFDDVVREVYATYTTSRFQIRAGRQQIGWGEADGLRVMDVINPLDLRRGPFYDTQGYSQVRIPKWLLKTELYPDAIGPVSDIALQLIWNPGDFREQLQLQLPEYVDAQILGWNTALGENSPYYGQDSVSIPNNAGAWGVPTPNYHVAPFQFNFKKRSSCLSNSEYGARLAFNASGTSLTLNYWNGFAHEALFDFQKLDYHPKGISLPVAADPQTGAPIFVPVAIYADFWYPRVQYAGLTGNREIQWLPKLLGINTNPVLRFEGLYSFNQKIQSTETPTVAHPFLGTAPTDIFEIYESDQIRGMIGFDWPIRISFINPKKNIFISGQYFHIHTLEMPGGKDSGLFPVTSPPSTFRESDITLDGSPYKNLTLGRNQSYCTLLLMTDYMNDRISPSVLYVQDLNTGSHWVKSELGFKIGDHWRPSVRYLYVDGGYQNSAFSVYRDRDEIALQIEYQF
jgi:hypothetical protein